MPQLRYYYPEDLIARTRLTMAEAVRKFPLQSEAAECWKYIISKLAPEFRAAIENHELRKRLPAHIAISRVDDLLEDFARVNSLPGLEEKIQSSDEQLHFYKEMDRTIDPSGTNHAFEDIAALSPTEAGQGEASPQDTPSQSASRNRTRERGGRPRKDDERERVSALRGEKKSWQQVADIMNRSKPEKDKRNKDAYRKLLKIPK